MSMQYEHEGGFENVFLDKGKADEFNCMFCQLVLKHPLQYGSCGHRSCKSCYQSMKQYAINQ